MLWGWGKPHFQFRFAPSRIYMKEIVEQRIKELERLVEITPINKSFSLQSRLVEAKHILDLINQEEKYVSESVMNEIQDALYGKMKGKK